MKSQHSRIAASAPIALAFLFASGNASAQQEVKVPHLPPPTQDIKTPAPVLPAKEAAPARTPVPIERVMAQSKLKSALPPALAGVKSSIPRDQVFFDQQADGTVWTRGNVFKGQFNTNGATYIPNFGPQAPQNYPLNFRLSGASVGGTPIAFSADAPATRAGDAVQFERGGLTEIYAISPDAVEQEFVFQSLPGSGELSLNLAVESELSGSTGADGIRFSNDLGSVGYGQATAIDAAGHRVECATTLDGNSIQIRVPAGFVADAVLPLTIDPVLTTFTIWNSGGYDTSADVAFDSNTNRYLVCWEDQFSTSDHDIYAQEYDTTGALVSGSFEYIDFTTNYWYQPRVANNHIGANFLVVATVVGSPYAVWGRTYTASAGALSAQFPISAEPGYNCLNPDVGGDPVSAGPTYFLVVWERDYASGDDDIHGQLVDSTGALSGGLILIDNSAGTLDFNPTVSKSDGQAPYSTQNWTVTWTREYNPGVDYDIWASQLLWNGTITNPTYSIDFTTNYDYAPMASTELDGPTGNRDYMVVYSRYDLVSDSDVHGQVFNGTGSLADANLSALDTSTTQNQVSPCVDSDGANYAVAYAEQYSTSGFDYDLYVSTFTRVGGAIKVTEAHQLLDFSGNQTDTPQIASEHGAGGTTRRSMLAWSDVDSTFTFSNIFGGLYRNAQFTSFCFPGVDAVSCPCGNPPAGSGLGCNNSSNTGGAQLTENGNASLSGDNVVFTSSGEKPTATTVFLQGSSANLSGIVFGQGIRCAAGTLKRLYVKTASGGVSSAPVGSDPSVSARSATLGDTINPGQNRYYLAYYRDPVVLGGCSGASTFNTTQTGALSWIP